MTSKVNKRLVALRILFWSLSVAIMALIFYFSGEGPDDSNNTSGGVVEMLLTIFSSDFREATNDEKILMIELYQHFIRKTAHFSIYAALGFSLFSAMYTYKTRLWIKFSTAAFISLVYAASDEYHQTFVPGRAGMIGDILIDFSGALVGILFTLLIIFAFKSLRNRGKGKMRKKELMKRLFELVNTVEELNQRIHELEEENKNLKLAFEAKYVAEANVENNTIAEEPQKQEEISVEENAVSDGFIVSDYTEHIEENTYIVSEENKVKKEAEAEVSLNDDAMDYGAEIIGKITVESAKYCDIITSENLPNLKELLGLIMGKSEVCKNDILGIALSSIAFDNKINMIDEQYREAVDYFKSICEQK